MTPPLGEHAGINRTYRKLRQFISWPGMKTDVEQYIRVCEKCQKNKMTQCHTRMPLVITDTLLYPARSQWGTYRGYCSRRDGARTSVKTGSWAGRKHSQ